MYPDLCDDPEGSGYPLTMTDVVTVTGPAGLWPISVSAAASFLPGALASSRLPIRLNFRTSLPMRGLAVAISFPWTRSVARQLVIAPDVAAHSTIAFPRRAFRSAAGRASRDTEVVGASELSCDLSSEVSGSTGVTDVPVEPPKPPVVPDGSGGPADAPGVAGAEGCETGPAPSTLVALTVNEYAIPFVRPETVHRSGPKLHVQVFPPGWAVTVYLQIGAPPSAAGAAHVTVTCRSPATTSGANGDCGTDGPSLTTSGRARITAVPNGPSPSWPKPPGPQQVVAPLPKTTHE